MQHPPSGILGVGPFPVGGGVDHEVGEVAFRSYGTPPGTRMKLRGAKHGHGFGDLYVDDGGSEAQADRRSGAIVPLKLTWAPVQRIAMARLIDTATSTQSRRAWTVRILLFVRGSAL